MQGKKLKSQFDEMSIKKLWGIIFSVFSIKKKSGVYNEILMKRKMFCLKI